VPIIAGRTGTTEVQRADVDSPAAQHIVVRDSNAAERGKGGPDQGEETAELAEDISGINIPTSATMSATRVARDPRPRLLNVHNLMIEAWMPANAVRKFAAVTKASETTAYVELRTVRGHSDGFDAVRSSTPASPIRPSSGTGATR
jgi:hypothetical protein